LIVLKKLIKVSSMKAINVKAFWDNDASVWVAESIDIPGLITEAETMEKLIAKIKTLIPELLEANGKEWEHPGAPVPFHLISECSDVAETYRG
jgi:predicted RNase H-like HicB family nuclease